VFRKPVVSTIRSEGSNPPPSLVKLTYRQWGMIATVFAGGFVLQVGWTNAELLLPLIQNTFHASTPEVGWVLAGFPIGYALFSFPGSVLTLRWGYRKTALCALVILACSSAVSAYAGSIVELIVLRFAGGAGAGLFFAPTAALLAESLPAPLRPRTVGLYASTGLGIGGALGFIEGTLLGPVLGWPAVFEFTAVVSVIVFFAGARYLPRKISDSPSPVIGSIRQRARRVVRSPWLWGLTIGFAGLVISGSLLVAYISTFVVDVHPAWGIGYAGILGSVGLFCTIPGSLLGSRLSESGVDRRSLAILLTILFSPVLFLLPWMNQAILVVDFILGGLLYGAILPLLFAMPSNFSETEGGNSSVAIGVIETSQVLLLSSAAVLFGVLVVGVGFTSTWLIFGGVALVTTPAFLLVPSNRAHQPTLPATG
jgi:predicted MFS family arabinose efflux permease